MRYLMEKCVLMGGILWWSQWSVGISSQTFLWLLLWCGCSFLYDWASYRPLRIGLLLIQGVMLVGASLPMVLPLFVMQLVYRFGVIGIVAILLIVAQPDLLTFFLCVVVAYSSYQAKRQAQRQAHMEASQDALQQETFQLYEKQKLLRLEHEKDLELAKLTERNRISHELHDEIGHTISTTIMNLEALQLVTTDPTIATRLEQLSTHLQQGMDQIRHTLHGMYDDTFQLEQKLQEVITPLTPHAQIDYQHHLTSALPLPMKLDILAIVKELMTNFVKHSTTHAMHLYIVEHPHILTIDYRDETAATHSNTANGIGLIAMREVVQKYHGELTINTKQGYHIFIRIPKEQEVPHD